jgi:hypothetical protein
MLVARCAGLDVHKDSVTACVRVPDGHGGRHGQTGRFTTTTAGLVVLAEWLASFGVTRVGMESTGCYWKPVWQLLEDQVECWLLNATHLRNVPGRKTDMADAAWIAQLVEHGLVRPSFEVAPADSGAARADSVSQDPDPGALPGGAAAGQGPGRTPGPELSSVATDIIGASGRAMLEALVGGTHDPEVLAALAKSSAPEQAPGGAGGAGRPVPHRPPRAAGRPAPGPRRRPGRGRRSALGADPAADRPVRRAGGVVGHHPRRRPACRRGHRGRDRPGHGPIPHRGAPGLLGRGVPWEQRVGRQAPLGPDPQGPPSGWAAA